MSHFICTGNCKAVTDNPSSCMASDCPKNGEPLEECSCEDDQHEGRQAAKAEDIEGGASDEL